MIAEALGDVIASDFLKGAGCAAAACFLAGVLFAAAVVGVILWVTR